MHMKWIKRISTVLLLSCLLLCTVTSCTEKMDGLNQDKKLISDEDLQADANAGGYLLPTMMNNIVSTDVGNYQVQQNLEADSYAGYMESPTPFLDNKNTMTYFMVGGWINVAWNVPSHGVMDNWLLMHKQNYETKYPDLYAIALIIRVFAGERVVDTFGPYPYTDYGNSADAAFNTVEEAYTAFFAELDAAIAALKAAEAANPDADQIRFKKWDQSTFNGEYTSWIKLANTLKLRCAMHIALVKPDVAKKEAEEAVDPANGGVLTTAEGSFDIIPTSNPYYTMINAWSDCRLAAPIQTYLQGFNDPRLPVYALPAEDPALGGKIEGIRPGVAKPSKAVYQFFSEPNFTPTTPVKQLDVAESYFLRAEGALRGWNMGGTAAEFYAEGVKASFQENGVSGVDAYLQGTTKMAAYTDPKNPANNSPALTDEVVKWDDNASFEQKLEKIITQKWIAMYPEGTEAWVEFRRTGYPKLYPVAVSNNPDLPLGTFIKRLTYPPTVTNTSQATVDAAVAKDLNGKDSPAERLWWDVK